MPASRDRKSWAKYVAAGQAFSAENFLIGAVGTIASIQLFCPLASGIRVRLRSVHSIAVAAQTVAINRHDVALTTLGLPAGFIVENLLGGQPVAVAEMRSQAPVLTLGASFWSLTSPGAVPAIYPPGGREWGHDLLPGQGIHLAALAGATLIVNWQWAEVPL